jgi:hypothetical protein
MKKIILITILFIIGYINYGQSFYFDVPNTDFQAEPGAGFDTRMLIRFTNPHHSAVRLSAQPPQGVIAIFQPDTIYYNDTVVLSIIVKDSTLIDQLISFDIKAKDSLNEIISTINLQVTDNWGGFPKYPAIIYRDQAINFLNSQHPDIIDNYGNMSGFDWQGFWQFPPLLVVSNYVFLTNNWRCNVLWHIMIPPYDWKKIFIYNDIKNVCWGVFIDTDGNFTEIPCEKHYYFFQDTNALSSHNDEKNYNAITIYPNPCKDFAIIELPNPDNEKYNLRIFNICGQLVQEINNIRENHIRVEILDWEQGVYFFQLNNESGLVGNGKIIKCND